MSGPSQLAPFLRTFVYLRALRSSYLARSRPLRPFITLAFLSLALRSVLSARLSLLAAISTVVFLLRPSPPFLVFLAILSRTIRQRRRHREHAASARVSISNRAARAITSARGFVIITGCQIICTSHGDED